MLFHASAIVSFLLFFADKLKTSTIWIFCYIFVGFFVGLFGFQYLVWIGELVGYGSFVERFGSSDSVAKVVLLISFNCFYIFIASTSNKKSLEFKFYTLFLIVYNLTIRFPFSERILLYFSVYQVLYYPYYLRSKRIDLNGFLSSAFVLVYAYCIFISGLLRGSAEILPYSNIYM
jgi:hypothetical protein